MTRVLVVGVPRSGTTWVATILGSTEFAGVLLEPDDHTLYAFAARAKRGLPGGWHTPVLSPDDEAPDYDVLWQEAFGCRGTRFTRVERLRRAAARRLLLSAGHEAILKGLSGVGGVTPTLRAAEGLAVPERPPYLPRDLIVKSVQSALSVEWIAQRTQARVVIVIRDVRNVVSSWVEVGWIGAADRTVQDLWDRPELTLSDAQVREALRVKFGVPPAPKSGSPLERLTWLLALLTLALQNAARANPDWEVVRHEEPCADPVASFRALANRLDLTWTERTSEALSDRNRPGQGFELNRVASELPTVWRSRLTTEQASKIDAVLEGFPLEST